MFDTQAPLNYKIKKKLFMLVRSQLYSFFLQYNVPVAELKRVNRLFNENDFYAKNTIKIPVKKSSLLTEILPFSERPKNLSKKSNSANLNSAKSRSNADIAEVHSNGSSTRGRKKSEVRGYSCGTAVVYIWIFCGGDSGIIALS